MSIGYRTNLETKQTIYKLYISLAQLELNFFFFLGWGVNVFSDQDL